jgi:hypothetical protein
MGPSGRNKPKTATPAEADHELAEVGRRLPPAPLAQIVRDAATAMAAISATARTALSWPNTTAAVKVTIADDEMIETIGDLDRGELEGEEGPGEDTTHRVHGGERSWTKKRATSTHARRRRTPPPAPSSSGLVFCSSYR